MPVAVVTGTSTGIGLATSVALARAGHRVHATMRSPQRAPQLAETAAAEKLPITILPMDVDDDASVSRAITQILAKAGRIDVLVNNAGVQGSGPVEEVPLAEFRRVILLANPCTNQRHLYTRRRPMRQSRKPSLLGRASFHVTTP